MIFCFINTKTNRVRYFSVDPYSSLGDELHKLNPHQREHFVREQLEWGENWRAVTEEIDHDLYYDLTYDLMENKSGLWASEDRRYLHLCKYDFVDIDRSVYVTRHEIVTIPEDDPFWTMDTNSANWFIREVWGLSWYSPDWEGHDQNDANQIVGIVVSRRGEIVNAGLNKLQSGDIIPGLNARAVVLWNPYTVTRQLIPVDINDPIWVLISKGKWEVS